MANFNTPDEKETPATRPPPPKLDFVLRDVLHNHKGQWPRMMPREPFAAADYWTSMQEPPKERERPEWLSKSTPSDPHAGGWQTPYIDRVHHNLRKFLTLTPNDQGFVIDNIQAGYPWCGDNMDFYCEVIKSTGVMREFVSNHGKAPDGLLPKEYTAAILKQVQKLAAQWSSNLPYEKNERLA
ncbi:MAG: hypothetical protein GY763_00310 [Gammaproteobacteria bacterium]|nr:hypothetical protein [Gammaproteobacteria bacterium]